MDLPAPWLYVVMNGCFLVAYERFDCIHYRSASSLSGTFNELGFTCEGTREEGFM